MHIYKYVKKNKVLDVDKIKSIRKEKYTVKNTACLNTSNFCVLNVQMFANLPIHLKLFIFSKLLRECFNHSL